MSDRRPLSAQCRTLEASGQTGRRVGQTRRMICAAFAGLIMLLCCGVSPALADSRALLVAIGEGYPREADRLPGPALDLERAKRLSAELGFETVHVLADREATKENILSQLNWLAQGLKNGERCLFYYSGHGTSFRDPEDSNKCAAALVPVDVDSRGPLLNHDIRKTIRSALTSPESGTLVAIVDACFSQNITKGTGREQGRYWRGPATTSCSAAINAKSLFDRPDEILGLGGSLSKSLGPRNYVVLTATAHNEVALDTTQGGVFTRVVDDTIQQRGVQISFEELREGALAGVRQICEKLGAQPYTPQLDGDPALFQRDLKLSKAPEPPAPTAAPASLRDELDRLVDKSGFRIDVSGASRVKLGDTYTFSVTSSMVGYLNVVEVNDAGEGVVLFPNKLATNNKVDSNNPIAIPAGIGKFQLRAAPPLGSYTLFAVVTHKPLNLLEAQGGKLDGLFKYLDQKKGLKVEGLTAESFVHAGAAKLRYEITE